MAKRLRQPSMTACQSVSAHECRQEAAPEVVGRVWSARCGFGLRCCLEKLLRARSRACIVIITRIPSICPASAGHFFAVANCCYWRSRRRLVGSLLDECLLDAVTNLGVHERRDACAAASMRLRSLSSRRTLSRAGCCRSSGCMVTPSSAVVALWDTTKSHRALDREGSAAPQQQQLAHCATCVTCGVRQLAGSCRARAPSARAS